jgi:thymidylate synthase (FAD)
LRKKYLIRPCGGIGRRAGFRYQCLVRESSSLSGATNLGKIMRVTLISYSQEENSYNWQKSITEQVAYCARVSNPGGQEAMDSIDSIDGTIKLIKYLIKHKHWSPFEMVSICMEIETTRDIARQILRHRSFSFQEFSQRYADPTKDLDFEFRHARLQDHKNRQSSIDCQDLELEAEWCWQQQQLVQHAEEVYQWARSRNIAKEQARAVLPEGNTISRIYMNGTLRSWIHYIELRTAEETQLEHRQVAEACKAEIAKIFPLIDEL